MCRELFFGITSNDDTSLPLQTPRVVQFCVNSSFCVFLTSQKALLRRHAKQIRTDLYASNLVATEELHPRTGLHFFLREDVF